MQTRRTFVPIWRVVLPFQLPYSVYAYVGLAMVVVTVVGCATIRRMTSAPTPTVGQLGYPEVDPSQLAPRQRADYAGRIHFDPSGRDDTVIVCTPPVNCGAPSVSLRIEPARGSNEITNTEFFRGWRVVARITLLNPAPGAHFDTHGVSARQPVAYWWVGPVPRGGGVTFIETRYYDGDGTAVSAGRRPLGYWTSPHSAVPLAKWRHPHGSAAPTLIERRVGGDTDNLGGLDGVWSPPAQYTRFHAAAYDDWFACDAGCCG
jgi:hypothetical protein